tara:strand:+ start:352 stop:540 length:189 start_codon:yes stop_codon:yes gene_type:complete
MLGGNQPMPKTLTREEMEAKTDNPFENPISGEEKPSWKLASKTDKKETTNKNKLTTSDTYQG